MKARKGILFLLTSLCLSANMAAANDNNRDQALSNASDLAKLSEKTTPAAKIVLPVASRFAGELRTSIESKAGNVTVNKAEVSKAMLGKFRINGI